jgi:hypothetical protein
MSTQPPPDTREPSLPFPGEAASRFSVRALRTDDDWFAFEASYGGSEALRSICRMTRCNGCKTVLVESEYYDLDHASEDKFWSRQFALDHTHVLRLHFFAEEFTQADIPLRPPGGYLGYAVILTPTNRVVRALVAPPRCMRADASSKGASNGAGACASCRTPRDLGTSSEGALAAVCETVLLFGGEYPVVGIPYCGQGATHVKCGHAAAWTCLYSAHLKGMVDRRTIGDIVTTNPQPMVSVQRAISEEGTNLMQLQSLFTEAQMPALVYSVDELRANKRVDLPKVRRRIGKDQSDSPAIFSVVCNYLNSGFPVVATTQSHALTIVGWRRSASAKGRIELITCDTDTPYAPVASPSVHGYEEDWRFLLIPLPPDTIASSEAVQYDVYRHLEAFAKCEPRPPFGPSCVEHGRALGEVFEEDDVSFRLQLKGSHRYKRAVLAEQRSRGEEVASYLALLRLPPWVWVVEVQRRSLRESGKPCVLAEFVYDPTSTNEEPSLCSASIAGDAWANWPYEREQIDGYLQRGGDLTIWPSQINVLPDFGLKA